MFGVNGFDFGVQLSNFLEHLGVLLVLGLGRRNLFLCLLAADAACWRRWRRAE